MRRLFGLLAVLLAFVLPAAGCGVATDMARDNEWRWGFWGGVSFYSPVKLKVGVAPFADEIGLGTPLAGPNLARLFEEELAQDDRLVLAPAAEVASAIMRRGYSVPLSPGEAAEVARELGLNAIVTGVISEVKQYQIRKGWRRLARVFTSQLEYVDAVLTVTAVDGLTGIVLASRANIGEYVVGPDEVDTLQAGLNPGMISQEAIEASLDAALVEAYHRTLEGLATLPFKVPVLRSDAETAVIGFGEDVGLEEGQEFVLLSVERTVTNAIGAAYEVPGAPLARLRVGSVSARSAELEILEGSVAPGDVIQAVP